MTPYVSGRHEAPAEAPFKLEQMAPRRRRIWPLVTLAVLLTLGGGSVAAVYALTRDSDPPARVVDGIPAPNPKCVTTVDDFGHPWVTDGWWAGRVDGVPREMSSQAAMATSLSGKTMEGVWICPPKRDW